MMRNQPRGGHIFNLDGAGSDGRPTPRFAAYGATKRSVVHLTKSLQAELQMNEVNNVMVHNLSPGMVTTDLLMSGATTKQAKFFINILAEPPDVVRDLSLSCISLCIVDFLSTASMFPNMQSLINCFIPASFLLCWISNHLALKWFPGN